jgi:integrase
LSCSWVAAIVVVRGKGRRDFAILVLARLGPRVGEVAHLQLDDIDWRAGEVVMHGKGRRPERLSLPVDVGEAVARYLHRDGPAARDGRCSSVPRHRSRA